MASGTSWQMHWHWLVRLEQKKQESFESESSNRYDGEEAYQTLVNWVKSVPNAIKEIEQNGSKEELIRYKKQVKMVVEKLKEIKNKLPQGNS